MPVSFSIIIPTYNRSSVLFETIRAVEQQENAPSFEVIVVDDGSTDATPVLLRDYAFQVPARVLTQENSGPATARNAGVRAATGRWVAFLGDDTIPTRSWLAMHHRAHLQRGAPERLAVVGYTDWHPEIDVTPFLRYINEYGAQFGYALIEDPEDVSFRFFYASNLSLPRASLLEEPFQEAFDDAAWEDIELGYRLQRRGTRLVYAPEAVTWHRHPMDMRHFLKRQVRVGRAARTFYDLHPHLGSFLEYTSEGPPQQRPAWIRKTIQQLAIVTQRFPMFLSRLWERALRLAYREGLHRSR